jgi:copper(I)-binding protein
MRNRLVASCAALALALTLAACGGDDDGDTAGDTGAGASTTAAGDEATGELTVTDVWARTSPMVAENGAAYMVITNGTGEDDALVGASVPAGVAARAELHETTTETDGTSHDDGNDGTMGTDGTMGDGAGGATSAGVLRVVPAEHGEGEGEGDGMMGMREVEEIPVPAGETVALEPGGYHVMLIDLAAPLEVGTTFELTLEFAKAGTIVVEAEVRDEAP